MWIMRDERFWVVRLWSFEDGTWKPLGLVHEHTGRIPADYAACPVPLDECAYEADSFGWDEHSNRTHTHGGPRSRPKVKTLYTGDLSHGHRLDGPFDTWENAQRYAADLSAMFAHGTASALVGGPSIKDYLGDTPLPNHWRRFDRIGAGRYTTGDRERLGVEDATAGRESGRGKGFFVRLGRLSEARPTTYVVSLELADVKRTIEQRYEGHSWGPYHEGPFPSRASAERYVGLVAERWRDGSSLDPRDLRGLFEKAIEGAQTAVRKSARLRPGDIILGSVAKKTIPPSMVGSIVESVSTSTWRGERHISVSCYGPGRRPVREPAGSWKGDEKLIVWAGDAPDSDAGV
jgi:hypothetical protein